MQEEQKPDAFVDDERVPFETRIYYSKSENFSGNNIFDNIYFIINCNRYNYTIKTFCRHFSIYFHRYALNLITTLIGCNLSF